MMYYTNNMYNINVYVSDTILCVIFGCFPLAIELDGSSIVLPSVRLYLFELLMAALSQKYMTAKKPTLQVIDAWSLLTFTLGNKDAVNVFDLFFCKHAHISFKNIQTVELREFQGIKIFYFKNQCPAASWVCVGGADILPPVSVCALQKGNMKTLSGSTECL